MNKKSKGFPHLLFLYEGVICTPTLMWDIFIIIIRNDKIEYSGATPDFSAAESLNMSRIKIVA